MRKLTLENFIKKANIEHNEFYDYSIVNYINSRTKIDIICPLHGIFKQLANNHLNGSICPKCRNEKLSLKFRSSLDYFIKKANEKHENIYEYKNVNYINGNTKITINCKIHGLFLQTPNNHLNGAGCPKCKESKGERKIHTFLNKYNIDFIREYTIDNCRSNLNKILSFDFYLPKYNLLIEYDGEQHYQSVDFFGGEKSLERQREIDLTKIKFAIENKYYLLKMPYLIYDDIDSTLKHILKL